MTVVDGGRLLMADPGSAVAISTADGAQLWENPTGSEGGAVSTGLGRAFRAGSNSAVAFDLVTGARAWRQSAGSSGFNQLPAAFDGAWMWVTGGGDNRAYDMRNGLVTTLFPRGGFVALSAPVGYQARERALVAFDLRTLAVRWQLPLPYGSHLSATAPLVVDELVLIATGGRLYAADRHTGALRWSGELSATQSTDGGLAAGDGHVVVPTVRGADVFRTASAPVDGGAEEGPVSLPDRSDRDSVAVAAAHQADVARPGTPEREAARRDRVDVRARHGQGRHLRRTAIGDPAPISRFDPRHDPAAGVRAPTSDHRALRRRRPAPAGPPHAAYVTVRYQWRRDRLALEASQRQRRGQIYVALAAIAWSTAGVLQRQLTLDTATQVAGRAVFAGVALLAYVAVVDRGRVLAAFRSVGLAGVAVAVCVAVASGSFIAALNHSSVARVLFILALSPVLAALLARVALGEPLTRRTVLAMALALAGRHGDARRSERGQPGGRRPRLPAPRSRSP